MFILNRFAQSRAVWALTSAPTVRPGAVSVHGADRHLRAPAAWRAPGSGAAVTEMIPLRRPRSVNIQVQI